MSVCKHEVLRLVTAKRNKLQCRYCHLIITEDELGDGSCPECLEVYNISRRDFKHVCDVESETVRYCCERCGMIIDC